MKNSKIRLSEISRLQELRDSIAAERKPENSEELLTDEAQEPTHKPGKQGQQGPRQSKVYLEYVRQCETPEAKARMAKEKENYFFEWPMQDVQKERRVL